MSTKLVYCTALALGGAALLAGQDERADAKRPTAELRAAIASRRLVDKGLEGAAERKPSHEFSGEIQKRIGEMPPGMRGSPAMKEAKEPDESRGSVKTIMLGVPARAEFDKSNGMAAQQAIARMYRAATKPGGTAQANDPRALLTSPSYGATLDPVQTFQWSPGIGVQEYYLQIGSCYDCKDWLDESEGKGLSRTVNLPTDGRVLYLTMFSYIGGLWYYADYEFYASNGVVPALLTNVTNGDTLNSPQTFSWSAGIDVSDYYLWIGTCQDCRNLLDEDEGLNVSRTIDLPLDGSAIFVSLFSKIGGNWFYVDYQFHAGNGVPVRIWIDNKLASKLNIFVNGEIAGTADPFSREYKDLIVATLGVSFEVVPSSLDGRTLGDEMTGYWSTIYNPSGAYTFPVTNVVGTNYYFQPELSNHTNEPLDIEVNGGLQAENKCHCFAPSFRDNVTSGYYRLFSNSNVRLYRGGSNYTGPYIFFGTDANGKVSPGGTLYQYVEQDTGVLHLTVTSAP